MAWQRRAAIAISTLSAALLLLAGILIFYEVRADSVVVLSFGLVAMLLFTVVGLWIGGRPAGAVVGALLTLVGLAVALTAAKEVGLRVLADHPRAATRLDWLVAATAENAWWIPATVALVLLYFPDGRLPSGRWRWVPPALVACAAMTQTYGAFDPTPFRPPLSGLARPFARPPVWFEIVAFIAFVTLLVLVVACAMSLVLRYRRGDKLRRVQIKWLAMVGLAVPLYPPLCLIEIVAFGHPSAFSGAVAITGLLGIPVATTIAILRHDLFDVDRALAGTVSWVLLTSALAGVYAVTTLIVGLAVGGASALPVALSAAVCAVALSPMRRRVQRGVDSRLYPLRWAAFASIDALHRDANAGSARPEELQRVLRVALRDPSLRVGFAVPGRDSIVDADGHDVDAEGAVPVSLGGIRIGVIAAGANGVSVDLLRQVASRCSTLVELVRLRVELANALRDAESSRARLVQIGYDERRKLERDLHDGAQQRLVSLGMALRVAQRHVNDGSVDIDQVLDQSVAELGIAVAELRQIAHGLRPGSLDDGLAAALASILRTVPVTIDMDVCADSLPDDIATTAYYIVSEAVTNAVKHADASIITLQVKKFGDELVIMVRDDGRGGASLTPTSHLADRVAALRGTLHVVSPAGEGTTLKAALPCAS